MHRVFYDALLEASLSGPGSLVTVEGDEAFHALRVKRLDPRELVSIINGRGVEVRGHIELVTPGASAADRRRAERTLALRVVERREHAPLAPAVHVWSAIPKGDRAADMVDQLSQVGAASWRPVVAERSVERTLGETKRARLRRVAIEAAKQSGRAWLVEVGAELVLADAVVAAAAMGATLVVADASGAPGRAAEVGGYGPVVVVLIGPEGGWAPAELEMFTRAGAHVVRLGPLVMRLETAAVAAAAVLMHAAGPEAS